MCLKLNDRDHVHVVDPETRLRGEAVWCWILPLDVRKVLAHIQILLLFGQNVDLKRNSGKDRIVHVNRLWNQVCLVTK